MVLLTQQTKKEVKMANVKRFEVLNTATMKKCLKEEKSAIEIGPIESIKFGRVILFSQCYTKNGNPYCVVFGFKMGTPIRSGNIAKFATESIPEKNRKKIRKALREQGVHGFITFLN